MLAQLKQLIRMEIHYQALVLVIYVVSVSVGYW